MMASDIQQLLAAPLDIESMISHYEKLPKGGSIDSTLLLHRHDFYKSHFGDLEDLGKLQMELEAEQNSKNTIDTTVGELKSSTSQLLQDSKKSRLQLENKVVASQNKAEMKRQLYSLYTSMCGDLRIERDACEDKAQGVARGREFNVCSQQLGPCGTPEYLWQMVQKTEEVSLTSTNS